MPARRWRRRSLFGAGLLALFVGWTGGEEAGELAVIAHPGFPEGNVSFGDLVALALGQSSEIGDTRVTVLLPAKGTEARATVLRRVYGMSESGFEQYWISRILRSSGGEVPKGVTTDQAIQLVQRIPGALAFVAADELPPGARILTVDGLRPGENGYRLGR